MEHDGLTGCSLGCWDALYSNAQATTARCARQPFPLVIEGLKGR